MKKYLFLSISFLFIAFYSSAQYITTFAGNGIQASTGDGGPATAASFNNPSGVFQDISGNTYVVEYTGNRIRKINPSGIVSTFAGNGIATYGGDGGPATNASLYIPIDIITDASGNVYIVDNVNQRIRKVNTAGIITTVAGNGIRSYSGDGGPATNASINDPDRIGMDAAGNLYIADADNNVIRKVDAAGIITTVVGTGVAGYSGDGGPATAATLRPPLGVAFDINGNMYIADGYNHVVRKVTPAGIISTYAGNGISGVSGNGGPATNATMKLPGGIAVDGRCNIYVTDWTGENVRKIFANGIITTVAGNDTAGFLGDGGPALIAEINGPDNLTFDPVLNLYIADFYNNRVRKVANLGESGGCGIVTLCDTTTSITISAIATYSATVSWSPASGSAGYQYLVNTTASAPAGSGTSTSTLSVSATGLTPLTTYYAHVRNNCGSGNFSLWETQSFTTLAVVGVNSIRPENFGIVAYPSPVKNILSVKIDGGISSYARMQLTDITGKLIKVEPVINNTFQIDMVGLPPGMYLIKYTDAEHTCTMKVNKE